MAKLNNLNERINERGSIHFQPGHKKHSTKNEMGEISTDWRRVINNANKAALSYKNLGADGMAMLFDIY